MAKTDKQFSVYVMGQIAKVMEDRKYTISTFRILGYGHLEITLQLIFHDCNEYFKWTKVWESKEVNFDHWYGPDREEKPLEFSEDYEKFGKDKEIK